MADRLRIAAFRPKEGATDGLRWIRWVDNPRPYTGAASSPVVTVRLEPLLPSITTESLRHLQVNEIFKGSKAANIANYEPDAEYAVVDAGCIPMLSIGSVFEDGSLCAKLPLDRASFTFEHSSTTVDIRTLSAPSTAPRPEDWGAHYRWPMLTKASYRRGRDLEKARLTSLHDAEKNQTLLIPCFEIFRSLMARHAMFARTLLMGPWELHRHFLINNAPDRTFGNAELNQIGLRKEIPDDLASNLHMMVFDPVGLRTANQIYPQMLAALDAQAELPSADRFVPFHVGLPFTWEDLLHIEVSGFRPYPKDAPGLFVGLEINGISWPGQQEINCLRDNSNKRGKNHRTTDARQPYANRRPSGRGGPDGKVDVEQGDDPSKYASPMNFHVPGPVWINPPKILPVEKEESETRTGDPDRNKLIELEKVAFGIPRNPQGDAPGNVEASPQPKRKSRFESVIAMLEAQVAEGEITGYTTLRPPDREPRIVNGFEVWEFPLFLPPTERPHRWALIEAWAENPFKAVRRTALVIEVATQSGRGHVIVTEPRLDKATHELLDNRRSLTCRIDGPEYPVIQRLLAMAVSKKGIWPIASARDWNEAGVTASACWMHKPIERDATNGMGRTILISPTPFLNSLKTIGG